MNGVGYKFLARSALSGNQNCGIGRADPCYSLQQLTHCSVVGDYAGDRKPLFQPVAGVGQFSFETILLESPVDNDQQLVVIERLGQVIECADPDSLDSAGNCSVRGENDYFSFEPFFCERLQSFKPAHHRHFEIE